VTSPPVRSSGRPLVKPGVVRRTARAALVRVDAAFSRKGPAFKQLALSWTANVAGDTLVAVALARTLFFDVPSADARDKVALYLLITLAPFTVVAPVLAAIFGRFPGAYRGVLTLASALRAVVAAVMAFGMGSFWLFPLAFGMLVLSRLYGISKASMLPVALPEPVALVAANALLARFGIYAGLLAAGVGAGLSRWHSAPVLVLAVLCFLFSAFTGLGLPDPRTSAAVATQASPAGSRADAARYLRGLRLSRLATAVVRLLNGFLLALLAFEFKEAGSALDFSALIGAAGVGFGLASAVSPWMERHLREEPMVVFALALEAAAAFVAAQFFSIGAAAGLAGAAGLAWGTAKFGFDGLLQSVVHPSRRGGAFTRAETLFQLAWVIGAVLPVGLHVPAEIGLAVAGGVALAAQTVFVAGLLVEPHR